MGSHDPFGYLKHKLRPKEGPRVKLGVWLLNTKSRESPQFPCVQVVCRWCAIYRWKAFDKGYNFVLELISIGGLHIKLWGPKDVGVLTLAILRLPLGSPWTKSHLDVGFVEKHKVYYKREGGGFPQVRVVVSLVSPSCPWLFPAPKLLQLCTNHHVLVLCRSAWIIDAYHSS